MEPERSGGWDWDAVAGLPGLSPVIDYEARESHWARYLDALHQRVLGEALRASADQRWLDYGCGVGRISRWLAPRVAEVLGVDPSPAMIAEAQQRGGDNVRYARLACPASEADVAGLGRVAGVTAIWVLQHILDDASFEHTVGLFARVLEPGGRVYTIDRLVFGEHDHRDRLGYQHVRRRDDYLAAFDRRGFARVLAYPILIDERVLGSGPRTWLVKRGLWSARLVARDLAFARRQVDPRQADYLFCFERHA